MSRVANLPWYDFPELEAATDALWSGVAARLRAAGLADVPERLARDGDYLAQWRDPRLLLSQACGYDVLYDAQEFLRPVAVPRFRLADCPAGTYRSAIVVRAAGGARTLDDLRGGIAVVNDRTSHSGTNAWRPCLAAQSRAGRFFREVKVSGDHVTSLEMVAGGAADAACVDVVVLELCAKFRPESLDGLREIDRTPPAPAPPWVTSRATDPAIVAALAQALAETLAAPENEWIRAALLIDGVLPCDETTYHPLRDFERTALALDYFELPAPDRSPLGRHENRVVRTDLDGCGTGGDAGRGTRLQA